MERVYNVVKVFSATRARERIALGDPVTEWLKQNKGLEVIEVMVKQSSDNAFHCLTILLFCKR